MLSPLTQSLSPLWQPPKVAAAGSYFSTVMADSPVAYYRLGEASGTVANDSSGGGNNGAYTGGYTLGQTGLIADPDTCVLFNGTTGYASAAIASLIAGSAHATLEAWVNRAASSDTCEIGFNANSGSRFEFSWYSDGNIYFVAENTSGLGGYALGGTGTHHIVFAYDGTQSTPANRFAAYVDGAAVTLNLFGTTPPTTLASAASLGTFFIGHDAGSSLFFNGEVDEVALYNTTLSASRILAHYNAGI